MKSKNQKKTQALNLSDKKFRALVEKAYDAFVLYDEQGFIEFASPSIKNFGGYKESDVVGYLGTDFVYSEDHDLTLEKFKETLNNPGGSTTFRQRLLNKDGSYKWCETTLTNLLNDPIVKGVVSNFRDISKQKEAEDKLWESKALLESINANINEAIYRNVPGQQFEYVNNAFLELFGFDSLQDLNRVKPASLYVKKETRESINLALKKDKKIDNIEVQFRKKSGKKFWGLISSTLVTDHSGREIYDGAIRDITLEKKARERLRESEQLLSSINLNIKEGIYRSSFDKGLLYVNDAFIEMFGYSSREEVLSVNIYDLYKDTEQRESIIGHLRRMGSIRNEEVLFNKKGGETFWGLMSSYVIKEGGREFFDGAIRDISNLKKVEDQLIKLNEELRKQNQALALREEELSVAMKELSDRNFELDQIVYKTSHDIRSPLTSILGLVNIAKKDSSSTSKEEYLDKIEQSILKLDEFVKSMLDYAKASRVEVKLQHLDLEELIKGCIKDLEHLSNYSDLKINIHIKASSEGFNSDPLRLKVIFSNIISNAFKYYDPNKSQSYLKIKGSFTKKGLKLKFIDNGIGISEPHLSKIFDMFYRATEKSEGSGLGMYIVKQSVEKLGGTIDIESEEYQGTTINIFLPHKKEETALQS